MSWIKFRLFDKPDEKKCIECLEDKLSNLESQMRMTEKAILNRLDTAEYKIKTIESFLDKITNEIDNRFKRLESERLFFKELEKPKKKAGRPKKDKAK